ncbi:PREDICTED: uncharacterized protein LOC108764547 [Trachymyrmex cornetzi]|uniref:uncharacterized protein LOC108764547 n=1 Tax=Trachymyrmex cornetzi TaxID=471704 RepID=UPI00084F1AE7|nr:PREDICTED: uncharacterized protein LOC108764547 [Trachymyrmex cornetzi]
MVRACCIPGCLSGQNVPSHMFPKDIERHKQWFKELNMKVIEDEKELKKLRICYQHFRNEDYTNSPTRRTLERNAIPSINVLQHADGMNVEHILQHTDGMNVEHIPQYTDGMNVEHIPQHTDSMNVEHIPRHTDAEDDIDCAPAERKKVRKKVHKILADKDDKVSEIAGIQRVIAIKIGAKVMIRRNIDVTLGFVNGTIGNIVAVNHSD